MEIAESEDFPADPVQGYFVDYAHTKAREEFDHFFCGPQDVKGAWCPNCQKPLLRFLALDTQDNRLALQNTPSRLLSLLFCWTCSVAQEVFFYRALEDGVELLDYGQGGVDTDFPYEKYPIFFPGAAAALNAISAEEQTLITRLNCRFESGEKASAIYGKRRDLWSVRHQIGGEPFLIQGLLALVCPDCGTEMPLLASIANDCLDERGLTGNDGLQLLFHYCRKCCVVGVYQECD